MKGFERIYGHTTPMRGYCSFREGCVVRQAAPRLKKLRCFWRPASFDQPVQFRSDKDALSIQSPDF
jgi:hypothetical protein